MTYFRISLALAAVAVMTVPADAQSYRTLGTRRGAVAGAVIGGIIGAQNNEAAAGIIVVSSEALLAERLETRKIALTTVATMVTQDTTSSRDTTPRHQPTTLDQATTITTNRLHLATAGTIGPRAVAGRAERPRFNAAWHSGLGFK